MQSSILKKLLFMIGVCMLCVSCVKEAVSKEAVKFNETLWWRTKVESASVEAARSLVRCLDIAITVSNESRRRLEVRRACYIQAFGYPSKEVIYADSRE